MRLTDLAQMVGRRGAARFLEKRGYELPAIALGLALPGIVRDADKTYDRVTESVNRAGEGVLDPLTTAKHAAPIPPSMYPFVHGATGVGKPPAMPSWSEVGGHLGGGLLGQALGPLVSAPAAGLAERIKGYFGPQQSVMDEFKHTAITTLGKSVADAGVSLLKDLASKAVSAVGSAGDQAARVAILKALKLEDPILAEQPDKVLMEAYHTMVRFAPTLSTDKNAVRSFLRQAVMSGSGPDYATIKLLADSENAVTNKGKER